MGYSIRLFSAPPAPKFFLENKWKQYNKKTWIQTRKLQIYIYS